MSLVFRLAGQRCASQFLKNNNALVTAIRPVTLKATKAAPPREESHDERNMKLNRPQSPHLTIYSPQLTAVLSITHRGTGMVLSSYVIGLGLAALASPECIPEYIEKLQTMPELHTFVKFSLAFPFSYHFWNGIRHLMWDTGKFLTIKQVYLTGYVMLALTFATAGYLTLL